MTSQQQQASSSSSSTTASTSGAHRNHPHQGHAQRNNRRSPRANLMPYHDPSSSHSHSHSHPSSPSSSTLGFTSSYPHPNPFAPLDTAGELGIGMLGIHVGGTTGVGMGSSLHLQSQHQQHHSHSHSQSLYPPTHSPSSRGLGLGMDGFGGGLGRTKSIREKAQTIYQNHNQLGSAAGPSRASAFGHPSHSQANNPLNAFFSLSLLSFLRAFTFSSSTPIAASVLIAFASTRSRSAKSSSFNEP